MVPVRSFQVLTAALLCAAPVLAWAAPDRQPAGDKQAAAPVVTPPSLDEFVPAEYPSSQVGTTDQPTIVLMDIEIDATGGVSNVAVAESGGPEFDAAATAAVLQFKFTPALVDGVPTPVKIQYKYVFTPPVPAVVEPVENLSGEVYHRWDKIPLPNIKVALPELDIVAETDESGGFVFLDIPPGEHRLELSGDGFISVSTEQMIGEDKKVNIRVAMEPMEEFDFEVDDVAVVRAPRIVKEVTETTIDRSQGEKVAGTQGDIVKVVQTLGGVARASAGSSELVVWGASPSDTRKYIDGVPVPRLFHIGGGRSVLSSGVVKSVSLVPGGYGATFGRAIGGLVQVETIEAESVDADREVFATVDPIDMSVGSQARLTENAWGTAAFRRSLQNESFDLVAPGRSKELVPIPDYWDYQAKTEYRIDESANIDVMVFGAKDSNVRGIPGITPNSGFSEDTQDGFHRIAARLRRVDSEGVSTEVAPWVGIDNASTELNFGDVVASSDEEAFRAGMRISERRQLTEQIVLSTGLDLELARTKLVRNGALALPAREGDITVFGLPPGNRVNEDRWTVGWATAGVYAAAAIDLFDKRVSVEPGLRLEPSVLTGDRFRPVRPSEPEVGYSELMLAVDPRLRVGWKPTSSLETFAAAGRYHQPPAAGDLSPVFGNPVLGQAEALHALGGVKASVHEDVEVDVVGFWVRQKSLAVRSEQPTPPTAKLLLTEGEGRNYGGQFAVRYRPSDNFFAWTTYSLMRAERMDHPNSGWRLFDSDQTHVLQMLGSWEHSSGLQLGGRLLLSAGFPRTPVEGAVFDASSANYDPIFGEHNSERIPTFMQLSLRAAFEGETSFARYKLWLDIQNVTNRSNAEEIIYSSDFRQRSFIEGLPILPLLGAEVRL